MKVLDTHVHTWWKGDGFPVRIRDRVPALDADFHLNDLATGHPGFEVTQMILVSSSQTASETERLFDVAGRFPDRIAGIIGFLRPDQDDFSQALAEWAGHEAFLGLRLPLVVMEDPTWIGGGTANAALSEIARRGLVAQVLAGPEHLRHCTTALEKHPELIAVLDHAANPPVQSGGFEPWAHLIGRFAAGTSAWCKVSDFHQAGGPPLTDRADPSLPRPCRLRFRKRKDHCRVELAGFIASRKLRHDVPPPRPDDAAAWFGDRDTRGHFSWKCGAADRGGAVPNGQGELIVSDAAPGICGLALKDPRPGVPT